MKVGKGSVVSLEYKLHFGDGVIVDASEPGDPLVYMHGESQIVPGLESALEGQEAGASLQVVVAPADGYGVADPTALQQVPRNAFPEGFEPKPGLELVAQGPQGEPLPFTIRAVEGDVITVDFNHPLAGRTLHFQVSITEVRESTMEEREHGHAHGPEGHGHDHGHEHQ
jgi:FKBP-type peptidyl-prolyl cis-trans isomerase SlyD